MKATKDKQFRSLKCRASRMIDGAEADNEQFRKRGGDKSGKTTDWPSQKKTVGRFKPSSRDSMIHSSFRLEV
jgi:hypothetical protein